MDSSEGASASLTALRLTYKGAVWVAGRAQAVSRPCTHDYILANGVQESGHIGTPSQSQGSRLPVLGGTRHSSSQNVENGPSYRASPMARQPLRGVARNLGNFSLSGAGKASKIPGLGGQSGTLGR